MIEYHVLLLVLLVGTNAFFTWLDVIDLRYGERVLTERAEWVSERFGVDDPERMAEYDRARTGLDALRSWVLLGLMLLVLYSGLFADAVSALESTGLGPLARGAVLYGGISVAMVVVSLPFEAVETFVVEELFDFNEQTVGLWVRDLVLELVVATAMTVAMGAALLWVVLSFPEWWWLGGLGVYVAFVLVVQVVYPRVIAPLFNDFEPIEEGELRDGVEEVFDRASFECDEIYEMDASRRSSHSNAYFVGFGRTKRVVLFDTLIDQLELPQVQSILAHELAHWKKAHIWKGMVGDTLQMAAGLFVAWFLLGQDWLLAMFGVPAGATEAGLLLAFLWTVPLFRLSSPLVNKLSLQFEREADDFAAEVTDPQPMIDALERITGENLMNPFSHPLYERFHHTHPPVPERIRRLEERTAD
ncbi:peptidase M48 [Halobacteriales archaeon QS_1_68_20]|nr:MAG: peptidase M48 [Halobacteriales archaeon QS_1_68_20]